MSSLLLKGGVALIHGFDDHITPRKTDILIVGNKISKIDLSITISGDVQVIDCTNKILSPGFIDTHHHLWQTLLKGRHADEMLLDFFLSGSFQNFNHGPDDVFWAQLAGCFECLDSGTTTVVDHASVNNSLDHSRAALAATVSSGIRSIFCYTPTSRVESWDPFTIGKDLLASWVINGLEELAEDRPFGKGRVDLGLAFDGFQVGKKEVVDLFTKAKSLGVKLITMHHSGRAIMGASSAVMTLESYGLLDSTILLAHSNECTAEEAQVIKAANAHVSSTPSTELQMGMGIPIAFSWKQDLQALSSLGVDCHSCQSTSIVSEMRILLQSARGLYSQQFADVGKSPRKVYKKVEEAFNLGTIAGARAIVMEDQLGMREHSLPSSRCEMESCQQP